MISRLIVTYGDQKRWGWKEELWVFCWLVVGLLDFPIFFSTWSPDWRIYLHPEVNCETDR